ncbi:MAG TPA: DNA N-6-adenine-methyltransferase, partial [bacterium]
LVKIAEAVAAVADTEEMKNAADVLYFEARRRRGEIVEAMPKNEGGGIAGKHRSEVTTSAPPTLASQGIDKREASIDYKLKDIPEEKWQAFLATEDKSMSGALRISGGLVGKMTGNSENYTPPEIIELIRAVMGSIDVDPASCEMAQEIVKAKKYYTEKNSGLDRMWSGNVFLNPPYGIPLIQQFTDKLIEELPKIDSAILLTNDQTDTKWFQKCARHAKVICFTTGRIGFYTPEKEKTAPTNGQAFQYFGNDEKKFIEVFKKIGLLVRPIIE